MTEKSIGWIVFKFAVYIYTNSKESMALSDVMMKNFTDRFATNSLIENGKVTMDNNSYVEDYIELIIYTKFTKTRKWYKTHETSSPKNVITFLRDQSQDQFSFLSALRLMFKKNNNEPDRFIPKKRTRPKWTGLTLEI